MSKLSRFSVRFVGVLVVAAVLGAVPLAGTASSGIPPVVDPTGPTGADVLMLEKIVNAVGEGAVPAATQVNEKDIAEGLGLTVDVVTDAQWAALTAADFAQYKAIVFGDPFCSNDDAEFLSAPLANVAVWGPVVRGNVFVHTFDAALHSEQDSGQAGLMTAGINYVTEVAGKTGLYVSTSCYDGPTVAQVLDGVDPGWTFVPQEDWDDVDGDTVRIVGALPPALAGLTDDNLSEWGSSTHGFFSAWPASYSVIALISDEVEEVDPPSADGAPGQSGATDFEGCECRSADAVTIDGVTGSPVLLIRPALEDVVIEPAFTG